MKKPLRSSFYWLVPCLALMTFAFFHSKAWLITKALWSGIGPFKVSVADIEAQNVSPREVYEGYDRNFYIEFDVTGRKPNWWMFPFHPADSRGQGMGKWKFWLEREGKRTPFPVSKGIIWDCDWNDRIQGYSTCFTFHSGAVPTDAALKVRALIQLVPAGYHSPYRFSNIAPLSPPFPVVFTLKKAGEKWEEPRVSTDPACVVKCARKTWLYSDTQDSTDPSRAVNHVTISSSDDGSTVVPIISQGAELDRVVRKPKFLDGQGRPISSIPIVPSADPDENNYFQNDYALSWSSSALAKAPQRDINLHVVLGVDDNWPFEIAFPVKKDGKPLFGVVPLLKRPHGK